MFTRINERISWIADDQVLRELAEILAAGYLRLQAHIRAEDKANHQPPNLSDRSALYSLDTPRPQSDEWCAARAASHSTERG